jgi:branched-subunit amino acid aminotransferase/4-amino-4-deoxychorismate lyase
MLDANGFVAEGSGENIFVVVEKKVLTRPRGSCLPGIIYTAFLGLMLPRTGAK